MQVGKRAAVTGALAATLLTAAPAAAAGGPGESSGVTREKGYAVACRAERDGMQVSLELYENSAHGTHVSLSVEADGTQYGGGGPVEPGLFDRGVISGQVPYRQLEEDTAEPQVARVHGSYEASGPRVRVREVHPEPWGEVVTKGWRTPLAAEVTVTVLDRQVPLTCGEAFAFDLLVRRVGEPGTDGRAH
ncbi:hypothetical protein ACFC5X_25735 [Streptomyces sp. NPDC055952]|uniref:hypothetical protein n=1 Tax=Streptomyces sp. NPDC055952 TaxID=3345663 RepID=UPI0035D60965